MILQIYQNIMMLINLNLETMRDYVLGFIFGMLAVALPLIIISEPNTKYDYKLELDNNVIHIETEEGDTCTIELEQLEELIKADNL